MRYRYLALLSILFLTSGPVHALQVSVNTPVYKTESSAYLEVYSKFKAEELQWASLPESPDKLFAHLEMLCWIEKDNEIVTGERYSIQSPELKYRRDFWDVRRFALENGEYTLRLRYVDLNKPGDTLHIRRQFSVSFEESKPMFSDILLLDRVQPRTDTLPFFRHGFSYEPLEFNLVDAQDRNLIFYTELYQLADLYDDEMFVKYFIENTEAEGLDRYSSTGYKKIHSDSCRFLLIDFPLDEFVSGNYILHLELNEKSKKRLCRTEKSFAVYNPVNDYKRNMHPDQNFESSFFQFMTREELDYSLKAIFPRVGNTMTELLNYIVTNDELEPKRYFLYNFWSGFSIENMKVLYDQYMEVARAVDNTYASNMGFGFETHRGYYFLKYGKPDDIIYEEDEPTAPPYEVWIYNYLEETQQTNVRFLFYNPSLAHNDFILLHSTCRGERSNPRWELDLYSDAYGEQPSNYIDSRTMPSNFHRNARKYFTDY